MKFFASSRLASIFAVIAAMGAMISTSGCGKSRAAAAQNPPPQTLSEPVRVAPVVTAPENDPPAIPVSLNTDYGTQKTGESRELPTFVDPTRSAPPVSKPAAGKPAAPASAAMPASNGNGKYYVMQKGDTLYAVSRKYNVKPKALIEANNFKDPNHVAVGTKIYIP